MELKERESKGRAKKRKSKEQKGEVNRQKPDKPVISII